MQYCWFTEMLKVTKAGFSTEIRMEDVLQLLYVFLGNNRANRNA